ncbi:NADPH-dependent F420 reductase [Undibacterium sp. Ji83W]|uniref:NADPH-dependent F420 reductase n=1 Tax=Undibacterium sp. Ji83W TaxID=3413043 RepID=UPI003BF09F7A
MKIAVIGTGNMGTALASLFSEVNLDVVIGHREPANAAALAAKLGAHVQAGGIEAACRLADIVFLALPFGAVADVLQAAGDLSGKVIVDITNPISADFKNLLIGHTTSAAEEIQALAPTAKVVKAFNTIFAQLLPVEARKQNILQVFVASDDAIAKDAVSQLVSKVGFEAIDAGPLSNSRFIEPIGEMNIHFGYFLGWGPTAAPTWTRLGQS